MPSKRSLGRSVGNNNSVEKWDTVFKHYSSVDVNPEKLEAACFLIENMDGHFSSSRVQALSPRVRAIYKSLDSLVKVKYFREKRKYPLTDDKEFEILQTNADDLDFESTVGQYSIELAETRVDNKVARQVDPDLIALSPNYLIDHIDNAFKNRSSSLIGKHISRRQFYETLLPYRIREEHIDLYSSEISNILGPILNPLKTSETEQIVNDLNSYLFYIDCFENRRSNLGDLGFFDALHFYNFECGRHSEWATKALNASGIPAYTDFTPRWLDRDRGHFWVSIVGPNGTSQPFTPKWQSLDDSIYFKPASKVYRYTYIKQDGPGNCTDCNEEIPDIFMNPYIKDVTELYQPVTDLSINFIQQIPSRKFVYLCIFGAGGWQPVGWGNTGATCKDALFKKVKTNTSYIVGFYDKGRLESITDPFFVDRNGCLTSIVPNFKKKISMALTSKFYEKDHLVKIMNETVGSKLEIAMKPDFSDAETIYSIKAEDLESMDAKLITIPKPKRGRYLRLLNPKGTFINLSEFECFSDRYALRPITLMPHNSNADIYPLTDHNIETYSLSKSMQFRLTTPSQVSMIRIAPRSANNRIVPGNRYELLYYDREWISAGIQVAKSKKLEYDKIPSQTIYWLRNHSQGREEQAFTYINGKQIYLNHDETMR